MVERQSILLDYDERYELRMSLPAHHTTYDYETAFNKAQAKKILIELQAIYNLPDGGMFHKKMGEFIKGLEDEISNNIC